MPEASHDAAAAAPDATVVVAAYNAAETIVPCVASLLALRGLGRPAEIIVVDNHSTDRTRELVGQFAGQVRLLSEPVRGAAAARNAGIRAARGQFVAFTDADCVVEPGWLAALIVPLAAANVGIAGGPILSRHGANRIERFGEQIHDHRRAIEVEEPPYAMTANWASRRDLLLAVGLFDQQLVRGQDVDLAWRIHRAGHRLVYVPEAIVRHRNERTIWGLMHEGYTHGSHGVRLGSKHAADWPNARRRYGRSGRRLIDSLRQAIQASDPVEGALGLLFNAGKSLGEIVALTRS
jgi:GT2 family glycosyltransferase